MASGMAKQTAARTQSRSEPGPARAAPAIQRTPQMQEMAKSETSRTPSSRRSADSGFAVSANQFGNASGIVRDNDRLVAVRGTDRLTGWSRELAGVVPEDVVRVLEDVAGENGDNVGIAVDDARGGEFADAGESGGGSGLAADA